MKAGSTLLKMLIYVKKHIKEVTDQEDRKIIEELTQTKIFNRECGMREIATLMRLKKDITRSHAKN